MLLRGQYGEWRSSANNILPKTKVLNMIVFLWRCFWQKRLLLSLFQKDENRKLEAVIAWLHCVQAHRTWTEHLIKPSFNIPATEIFLLPKFPHQENPLIYWKIRAPKFLFFNPQRQSEFFRWHQLCQSHSVSFGAFLKNAVCSANY